MAEDTTMTDVGSTLYEVRDSPGQGVFATQDIPTGTRIWQEKTLIETQQDTVVDVLEQFDALERIKPDNIEQFNKLRDVGHLPPIPKFHKSPDEVREVLPMPPPNVKRGMLRAAEAHMLMTEAGAGGKRMPKAEYTGFNFDPDYLKTAAKVLSIFERNAFPIPNSKNDEKTKAVVFAASHLNHSCIPNCHAMWNDDIRRLCVHAVRNIRAGEELRMMYHPDDLMCMDRKERKNFLTEWYGISCSCPACGQSSASSKRMDKIAARMYKIRPYLQTKNENHPGLVGEYTKVLNLMKEDANLDNWQKGHV